MWPLKTIASLPEALSQTVTALSQPPLASRGLFGLYDRVNTPSGGFPRQGLLAGRGIPDVNRAVKAARGQGLAVLPIGHAGQRPAGRLERLDLLARGGVPDFQLAGSR